MVRGGVAEESGELIRQEHLFQLSHMTSHGLSEEEIRGRDKDEVKGYGEEEESDNEALSGMESVEEDMDREEGEDSEVEERQSGDEESEEREKDSNPTGYRS